MARHRVKVLEGDQVRESLVPFATVYEYTEAHDGTTYNEALIGDWAAFVPWVAWHTFTHRGEETRPFEQFVASIEWVTLEDATDELDPSGGEPTPKSSSPESSPGRPSGGTSSSRSRTASKKPSGAKSKG